MSQKGIGAIAIILIIFFLSLAVGAYFFLTQKENELFRRSNNEKIKYEQQKEALKSASPKPSSLLGGSASLANPASEYCIKVGGSLQSETRGDGGEYSICNFEDNQSCEEWALYRGDCPIGGIKTVGFDTPEEVYCAQIGGKTLATHNSNCTLPDGKVCSNMVVYNGNCQ